MGAKPRRKMVLSTRNQHRREPCGPHHRTLLRPRPSPSSRRRTLTLQAPPPVPGLQAQDLSQGSLVALAGRRRPNHLAVRRLPTPSRRPFRRDGAQAAALGYSAQLHAALQHGSSRAAGCGALCPERAWCKGRTPTAGHRPDAHSSLITASPSRNLDEIYRGQAKDGTSHFHAYAATAYVVRKGNGATPSP